MVLPSQILIFEKLKDVAIPSLIPPILVERSPMAAYHIFAKVMRRSGHLTIWEMNLLRRLMKKWEWIPEHTFLVWTPYKEALKRLKKRDRTAEKDIKEEFLRQLELRHRAFIQSGLCGKVHILDGSLSKQELLTSAMNKIDAIRDIKRSSKWPICPWSLQINPPCCDWEPRMTNCRLMLGPLPRLITQTLRCRYLVDPI